MSRLVVGATWYEPGLPHMTEKDKAELIASFPAYLVDARTRGIPQLGAGAIYPFPETNVREPDFDIPAHWPRGFGLDCALSGMTAAVWGALDRDSNVVHIYSVYKMKQADTAIHVEAFKGRGLWIPGVGDAADVVDSDRTQFLHLYRRYGLNIELPNKAVETGIQSVYNRFSAGKLKVFASCVAWFDEFRMYQRDDHQRVKKVNDHLMDATRYLIHSGLQRMRVQPQPVDELTLTYEVGDNGNLGWMR